MGTLLDSFTIAVGDTGISGTFDLWQDGEVNAPALVEVVTDLHHEGRTIAIDEFFTSDGAGTVAWWKSNGDLLFRGMTVWVCGTPECTFIENVQEIIDGDPADSLVFRDTDAAEHGLRLGWHIGPGQDYGYNVFSEDPPPECVVVFNGMCWPPPPFDSANISDSLPTGMVRVSAYLPEEADAELLLTADTTELHPWITGTHRQ